MNENPYYAGPKKYWRDASNRLVYSLDVPADQYQKLCKLVIGEFRLGEKAKLVVDPLGDVAFQDFECEGKTISLEWDIWFGFMAVAKTPNAEDLVQRIGSYVDSIRGA